MKQKQTKRVLSLRLCLLFGLTLGAGDGVASDRPIAGEEPVAAARWSVHEVEAAPSSLREHFATAQGVAPENGLPDGGVAQRDDGDIRAAWYAAPTRRYRHGVLGDDTEAGRLVVRNADGRMLMVDLPEAEVFEDITPRLADLDGDGLVEVIAIRSSSRRGASVTVYGIVDGQLAPRATTPFIGRSNRWLNIAGIADYLGEGGAQIAYVETPHIGGTLYLWSFRNGALTRRASLHGFSNHAIGSRILSLSATVDLFGDGAPELIVPDDARRVLKVVKAETAGWRVCDTIPMAARIEGVAVIGGDPSAVSSGEKALGVLLDDGAAFVSRSEIQAGEKEPDPCR